MADNDFEMFELIDVSEPQAPRKEIEIIEEALKIRRRDWIKSHMSYIYAVIGIIMVAVIAFVIYFYFSSTNPMSCFIRSLSKDFGTSFDFDVQMTEDGEAVMSYEGSISLDRSKHALQAHYDADYGDYTFTGETYAVEKLAMRGTYYEDEWTVSECTDDIQDFFDFDRDFRSGGFDGGAFLRFTKLTSNYSTRELNKFVGIMKNRFSADSDFAAISSEQIDGGTLYTYDVDLNAIFEMIRNNGASVFYRATDYDTFVAMYDNNKNTVQNAECTISFFVNSDGYMSSFDISVITEGTEYGLSCRMSNFGTAEVELSDDFYEAAMIEQ